MQVYIESKIDEVTSDMFSYDVIAILNMRDSWLRFSTWDRTLEKDKSDFQIYLVPEENIVKDHGKSFKGLSVAALGGPWIHINYNRWKNGSVESKLSLHEYRIYLINHEVGHLLGLEHPKKPTSGPCPVMWQQTKSQPPGTTKNIFPTKKELTQVRYTTK